MVLDVRCECANMTIAGGDWWTDDYSLRAIGVLDCPVIETSEITTEPTGVVTTKSDDDEWVLVK